MRFSLFSFLVIFFFPFGYILITGAVVPLLLVGRYTEDIDLSEGLPLYQNLLALYFFLNFLLIIYSLRKNENIKYFSPTFLFFTIFVLYCISSVFWSVDVGLTVRRSISLVGVCLYSFSIFYILSFNNGLKTFSISFIYIIVLCFVFFIILPGLSIHNGDAHHGFAKGVYMHKNLLGREMALIAPFLLYIFFFNNVFENKKLPLYAFFAGSLLVFLAGSVTGIITYLICIFLLISVKLYNVRLFKQIVVFIFVTVSAIFYINAEDILSFFGRDLTFTGRDLIWSYLYTYIEDSFLFGYGYKSFWPSLLGDYVSFDVGYRVPHAHNGYLDLILELGIVGFFVLLANIFILIFNAIKSKNLSMLTLTLMIVANAVFVSFSDSILLGPNNYFIVMFSFLIFSFSRKFSKVK